MNPDIPTSLPQELQKFRITFTKGGKQFIATVKALSHDEAVEKLKAQFGQEATPQKTLRLYVQGTHCASCEVLIERRFKKLPGVKGVDVNYRTGETIVTLESGNKKPSPQVFENAISDKGYQVHTWDKAQRKHGIFRHWTPRDFREVGAVLLVLLGGYLLLRQFDLLPKNLAVTQGATYPFIFLVGLVAASSSCLAVVGGLLVSLAGLYSQATADQPAWKRFQPHVLFNVGRLGSYALLGGVIGTLGKAFSLSSFASGAIMVLAAAFMLLTGLSMLNLISRNPLLVSLPKRWQNAIHEGSGKQKVGLPFLIGAATFFLPCGFTQSMQLYAITTGSFEKGALTMLVFALGTMPALLGIGVLSTFTKGAPYRLFLKFAGAFVLVLAIFNLNNGMTLAGFSASDLAASFFRAPAGSTSAALVQDPNVVFDGHKQVVSMKVYGNGYIPNAFTIKKGIPVEWKIDGVETYGCTSVLKVPAYHITKQILQGPNVVEFTPEKSGTIAFHCSMAMFRGKFTVVD